MLKSHIEFKNNKPFISVKGELHAPVAYTTYFEECGEFSDFINCGYKMFFVNVSFTDLPINNMTGFSPFLTGVFENETPDYSEFDGIVNKIISECHDAFIFPRINIAMPRKWLENHPEETVKTVNGGRREALYSDLFLRDGAELLKKLVLHIRTQNYADRIAGYQLCGGTTQEWIHHDMKGSFSEKSMEKFKIWIQENYPETDVSTFSEDDLINCVNSEAVSRFGEFSCQKVSETVEYFCRTLKEYINNEQIVGAFYGYNAFVNDYLWGLHGLRFIIDSPYIDFFSSPCGYDRNRELGIDWGDMLPSESVKVHGKQYFVECDVRTYLTRKMQSSRPGKYPEGIYLQFDENGNRTVWSGPETKELSLSALYKTFAHQLTRGSGIWWFDMWGGWYHDDFVMKEMEKMKSVADYSKDKENKNYPASEIVFFIDEKAYLNNPRGSYFCHCVNDIRIKMGNIGIPFDLCMVEDAEKVACKYSAAIFPAVFPSEYGKKAMEICKKNNIAYLQATEEKHHFTENELRAFLTSNGVHCYTDDDFVIYCGGGFLGVHAVRDGEVKISLPEKYKVKSLLGVNYDEKETDEISVYLNKHHTAVFELI